MPLVYLSLGSNIPPREQYITTALSHLQTIFPDRFVASCLYETEPFGGLKQNAYLNCCAVFFTTHSPFDLLKKTQKVEVDLERFRSGKKWDSRTIDIDILLYGEEIIKEPGLQIPHYDLQNRDFFLLPLLELDKNLVNFVTQKSFYEEYLSIPKELRTFPRKILPR